MKERDNYSMGYICLYRSIREHWIFGDDKMFRWWADILLDVAHTNTKVTIKGQLLECRRGETLKSLQTWAIRWGSNPSTVRRFLKLLEKDGMITLKDERVTTRITVCNYDSYQQRGEESEMQKNRRRKGGESQEKTNNALNNYKNIDIEKYSEEERDGFRKFQAWIEANTPSVGRMKEPFTIDQFVKLKKLHHFSVICEILNDMENWELLNSKRKNAFKTFNTFFNKRQDDRRNGYHLKAV